MSQSSNLLARVRRAPLVFKAAATILLIAAVLGQWQRHQDAGALTREMISIIATRCPAAMPSHDVVTVQDGAAALNRWSYDEIADRVDRSELVRCTRRPETSRSSDAPAKPAPATRGRHKRKKAASRRRK